RKKCASMVGLIQEGDELMDEDYEDGVKDVALISAAQRVEHYEIAAYGCVSTWAGLLGDEEAKSLLEETLSEEKETDRKLTELSETLNEKASRGKTADVEDGEETKETDEEAPSESAKPRRAKAARRSA